MKLKYNLIIDDSWYFWEEWSTSLVTFKQIGFFEMFPSNNRVIRNSKAASFSVTIQTRIRAAAKCATDASKKSLVRNVFHYAFCIRCLCIFHRLRCNYIYKISFCYANLIYPWFYVKYFKLRCLNNRTLNVSSFTKLRNSHITSSIYSILGL